MAITFTHKETSKGTSDPQSTGSLSWTAGSRALLAVVGADSSAVSAIAISGGGVDWIQIESREFRSRRRMALFISDETPQDGVLTITPTHSGTYAETAWSAVQVAGFERATLYDADQFAECSVSSTSVDLPSLGTLDTGDAAFFMAAREIASDNLAVASGSTELGKVLDGSDVRGLITGYSTTDATPGTTWDTSAGATGETTMVGLIFNTAPTESTTGIASGGGEDYTTIADWEATETAAGSVGEVRDNSTYAENVTIDGSTNRKLTVASANRHSLDATGPVVDPTSNGHAFTVSEAGFMAEYIRVTGLQGTSSEAFRIGADEFHGRYCYVHGINGSQMDGFYAANNGAYNVRLFGCAVVEAGRASYHNQGGQNNLWFFHNTLGLNSAQATSGDSCYQVDGTGSGYRARNCFGAAAGSDTAFSSGADSHSDYNASDDTSGPGANATDSVTLADEFVTVTAGSEDIHLKSGNTIGSAGTTDSAPWDVTWADAEGDTFTLEIGADAEAAATNPSPGAGSIVYGEQAPSLKLALHPGAGSAVYTGQAPALGLALLPGLGSIVYSGQAPSLALASKPGVGSLVYQGFAPFVPQNVAVTPGAGTLVYDGKSLRLELSVGPGAGTLVYGTSAPRLVRTVSPALGTVVFTPQGPTLLLTAKPGAGGLVYTGHTPLIGIPVTVEVGTGRIVFVGHAPAVDDGDVDYFADAPWLRKWRMWYH